MQEERLIFGLRQRQKNICYASEKKSLLFLDCVPTVGEQAVISVPAVPDPGGGRGPLPRARHPCCPKVGSVICPTNFYLRNRAQIDRMRSSLEM